MRLAARAAICVKPICSHFCGHRCRGLRFRGHGTLAIHLSRAKPRRRYRYDWLCALGFGDLFSFPSTASAHDRRRCRYRRRRLSSSLWRLGVSAAVRSRAHYAAAECRDFGQGVLVDFSICATFAHTRLWFSRDKLAMRRPRRFAASALRYAIDCCATSELSARGRCLRIDADDDAGDIGPSFDYYLMSSGCRRRRFSFGPATIIRAWPVSSISRRRTSSRYYRP